MKCRDFEADIYLYSELSAAEQKRVDIHIKDCKACSELFELVAATQALTARVGSVKPEPENHSRLTSNIMQGIASKPARPNSWLYDSFFKYAMMAASLALIVVFGIEQSKTEHLRKEIPIARTVTLQSRSLSEAVLRRKQKPERKPSLYACAKSGDCNNVFIKNFRKSF